MTLIISLIAVILAGGGIGYLIIKAKNKKIKDLQKENEQIYERLRMKEKSVLEMQNHVERINLTEKELKPIKKEVKDAKTDAEVILAIGNIIKRNNSRIMPDND